MAESQNTILKILIFTKEIANIIEPQVIKINQFLKVKEK